MPNHTNQLLDKVVDLLIENHALDSALQAVKRLLPLEAQMKIRSHIEEIKSDPTLRELVRRRFAQYRDQPENPFSQLLEEDFKKQRPPTKSGSRLRAASPTLSRCWARAVPSWEPLGD